MPSRRICFYIMLLGLVWAFMPGRAEAAPVEKEWGTAVSLVQLDSSSVDLNAANFKGVTSEFAYMRLTFTESGVNQSVSVNQGHSLADITVTGGGTDETRKFTPKLDSGTLKLQLNQPAARLREGTLYKIDIPAGTLVDLNNDTINKQITVNFVTLMQNPGRNDILVSTSPAAAAGEVSEKTRTMVWSFVDNITMASDINNYILFSNTPVIPGADCDAPGNYDITATGRQLILTAKNNGTLKDFVNYDITLKKDAVKLTGTSIANDELRLPFSTNRMYSSVTPDSGQTGVGLEPVITFTFKQPIEILDQTLITLAAAGEAPVSCAIRVADDRNLLMEVQDNGNCLARNTCYTVTLQAGALRFLQPQMNNNDIVISFTTTTDAQQPIIIACSSDPAAADDITSLRGSRLGPEGCIYIHFDRAIAWDREYSDPLPEAQLYSLPAPTAAGYDPNGWNFDQEYTYDANGLTSGEKEIPIKSLYLAGVDCIGIKPLYPLANLNCYRFKLGRKVVDDIYGCNMEKDIDFTFWTMPGTNTAAPAWQGLTGVPAEKIMTGSSEGTMTYTVLGTAVYSRTVPLTLETDSEVIVKAGDDNALKRIKLTKKGDADLIDFTRFQLAYYYDGNLKKTRISIYPDDSIQTGQGYCLAIPGDVFQTRAGVFLPALTVFFTPGNEALSVYNIEPSSLSAVEIAQGKAFFQIKGFCLDSTIQKVVLTPVAGRCLDLNPLTIAKPDLYLINAGTLKVMLRGDNAAWLSREEASGTYRAEVWYGDVDNPVQAAAVGEASLHILSRGVPAALSFYPSSGSTYDETGLLPQLINGTTRYFLSVKWQDPGSNLELNLTGGALTRLKTSSVYAEGGSQVSMVDTDFITWIENIADNAERSRCINTYLYNSSNAILYIPVRLLRPQTTYTVSLNEDIVKFTGGQGNELTTWSFSTMAVPSVLTLTPGSVVEDYAAGTYILIQGSFFTETGVTVKFNDRLADSVNIITLNGKACLKAFLPRSSRLSPGVYNITVINDSNHQQTLYSAFSVVKQSATAPPVDGQRTRSEGKLGDVVEKVKTSEAVLQLDNDYRDRSYLKIDLDKLMGEKVLTRTVSFEGRRGERINELETLSRWADITVYGLTLKSSKSRDDLSLQLGRVDAARSAWLSGKLRGRTRVSDYIEVGGSNFRLDRIKIKLPFNMSEGRNLRVLRYDHSLRNFLEVPFTVDQLEGTVLLNSLSPGIFVVVE